MSSSGLVLPSERSVRAAHVTGVLVSTPLLLRLATPCPCVRLPCHVTSARRSATAIVLFLSSYSFILRQHPAPASCASILRQHPAPASCASILRQHPAPASCASQVILAGITLDVRPQRPRGII